MLAFVAVLIKLAGELHGAGGWTAVPLRVLTGAGTNCVHAQVGRPGLLYEDLPSSAGSVRSSLPADGSRGRVARVWRQSACVCACCSAIAESVVYPSGTAPAARSLARVLGRAAPCGRHRACSGAFARGLRPPPLLPRFRRRPLGRRSASRQLSPLFVVVGVASVLFTRGR